MIFAQFFSPRGKLCPEPPENPRALVKLVPVALPIGEAQSLDSIEFAQRPGEAGGRILPAREQNQRVSSARVHRSDVAQGSVQGESSGRNPGFDGAFGRKFDRHGWAFAGHAQNRKAALMQLNKRLRKGQTEAYPFEAP